VADTIRALKGLMTEGSVSGEIFNVGSTERIAIGELANRVLAATGSSSETVFIPYDRVYGQGIEDMLHRIPATEKVRAAIGWSPEHDLERILEDVIAEQRASVAA
jgi:UDP-glucose 4-epimerase